MAERRKTLTELKAETELAMQVAELEADVAFNTAVAKFVPSTWEDLPERYPCKPPKTRVTLLVDRDVAKFFRAMGRGHQARMNAVLRTFMLALLSKEIVTRQMRDRRGRVL
ncbi:MAG: BrnA antitoxin family protein [Pseudomonadota bacterium]